MAQWLIMWPLDKTHYYYITYKAAGQKNPGFDFPVEPIWEKNFSELNCVFWYGQEKISLLLYSQYRKFYSVKLVNWCCLHVIIINSGVGVQVVLLKHSLVSLFMTSLKTFQEQFRALWKLDNRKAHSVHSAVCLYRFHFFFHSFTVIGRLNVLRKCTLT